MTFITSFERDGIVKGKIEGKIENNRENIIEVLETRFASVPENMKNQINALDDLALLKSLVKQAVIIVSLEEFQQLLISSQ